ncbi:MAG: hypothetical protein ACKO04_10330 [Actinomycetes bacterium]
MLRPTALRSTRPLRTARVGIRRSALVTAAAVAATLLAPGLAGGATTTQTLVPAGAAWKYRDSGSQATGWERKVFDDTNWRSGKGQLGAGDGDEATVVNRLAPAHPADWFRTYFTVADRTKVASLTLSLLADDGAVVYFNGAKAVSDNMNWGGTAAAAARTGTAESQYRNFSLPVASLVNGTNTLAVAVFQTTLSDPDVSFDATVSAAVTVPTTTSTTTSTTSTTSTTVAAAPVTVANPVVVVDSTTTTTTTSTPSTTTTAVPTATTFQPTSVTARLGGCQLYGKDHFLNATGVERLPVRAESGSWTDFLGGSATKLVAGFTAATWSGSRPGMPMNVVDSRTTGMTSVLFDYTYTDSYSGGYPVPANPVVEGAPTPQWDQHVIMVDQADCTSYELIQYDSLWRALFGSVKALAGAKVPLTGTAPTRTTNAAQTPMVGQNVLVSEVNAGKVDHVVGFCTTELSPGHTWPARASDGKSTNPAAIRTGAWLRLKAGTDTSRFTGQARPIVEALRTHGAVLTDTCGQKFALMGENSTAWNDTQLAQLGQLTAADFEAVDTTPMKVADTSWAIR